jgi:hypothetical protein
MGKFITTNVRNINTRDVFVYQGTKGYVIALTGLTAWAGQQFDYHSGRVGIMYSDGTGSYKTIDVPVEDDIELLRFDNEYYTWRKALLKNTHLEHLTA